MTITDLITQAEAILIADAEALLNNLDTHFLTSQ